MATNCWRRKSLSQRIHLQGIYIQYATVIRSREVEPAALKYSCLFSNSNDPGDGETAIGDLVYICL